MIDQTCMLLRPIHNTDRMQHNMVRPFRLITYPSFDLPYDYFDTNNNNNNETASSSNNNGATMSPKSVQSFANEFTSNLSQLGSELEQKNNSNNSKCNKPTNQWTNQSASQPTSQMKRKRKMSNDNFNHNTIPMSKTVKSSQEQQVEMQNMMNYLAAMITIMA